MPREIAFTRKSTWMPSITAGKFIAFTTIIITAIASSVPASAYEAEDIEIAMELRGPVRALENTAKRIPVPDKYCNPNGDDQKVTLNRQLEELKQAAIALEKQVLPIYNEFVDRGYRPGGAYYKQDVSNLKSLLSKIRQVKNYIVQKQTVAWNVPVVDCVTGANTQANRTPRPAEQTSEPEEHQTGLDDLDEDMKENLADPDYYAAFIPDVPEGPFCSELEKIRKATSPVAVQRADANLNWTLATARLRAINQALKTVTVAADRQQLETWRNETQQQEDHWHALFEELDILYAEVKQLTVVRCTTPQAPLPPTSNTAPGSGAAASDAASNDLGLDIQRPTYEPVDFPNNPESALCDERLKDQLIYVAEQAVRAASANDARAVSWLAPLRHALDNNLGNRPAVQRARDQARADVDHWKEEKTKALEAVKAAKAIRVIDCEQRTSNLRMPSAPQQDQRSTLDDLNQQDHLEALQNMLYQRKPKVQPAPRSFVRPAFQTEWDLTDDAIAGIPGSRSNMKRAADAFFGTNGTDVGSSPGGVSTSQPKNSLNFPQAAPSGGRRSSIPPTDSGTQTRDGIAPITTRTIDLDNQPFKPNRSQGFQNGNKTVNGNPLSLGNQPQRRVGKTGTPQNSTGGMTRLEPEPLQFVPGTTIRGVNVIPPAQNGPKTQGSLTGN